MTIASISQELAVSAKPIAKALHKSNHCKAICIGLKKDMHLNEHKTNVQTTLLVLSGTVKYAEGNKELHLCQYEQHNIPVNVLHAVVAIKNSFILLIQG